MEAEGGKVVKLFGVEIHIPIEAEPPHQHNPGGRTGVEPVDDDPVEPPKKKKKRAPMIKYQPPPAQPLPPMHQDFLNAKAGENINPTLILTRTLYPSDVSAGHGRLTMPRGQILNDVFLEDEEKAQVEGKDELGRPKKLQVMVVDHGLKERSMNLTKWNYNYESNRTWWYALTGNWMDVVRDNGLSAGGSIQVWSFRVEGKLGFLIHKI